jgi:hypothetical protein
MHGRRPVIAFVVALGGMTVPACNTAPGADPTSSQVLSHDFPALSVDSGQERNYICQSWTLNNDEPLNVNALSLVGGPGWHHSNWLYAAETKFAGPDGTWPCADRGFELVEAGVSGGVIYTQSPEVEAETERFGPGVAVVIPPHSKIIAEIHLLNATDHTLTTNAHLDLDLLPAEQTEVRLSPLGLSYYPLALPPMSESEFTTDCDLASAQGGAPLDFSLYYIAPHYHARGEGMRVEAYDSSAGSKMIYDISRKIGEPLAWSPPVPFGLAGSQGIRFTCRYQNNTPNEIGYGSSQSQEMCVMFAFTDSPMRWIGGAPRGGVNTAMSATDPSVPRFTSKCSVLALQQ